jgi:hypothetical protein
MVAVRRLSLSSAEVRGNVGAKYKGLPGFIGYTELDNVNLHGDVDIDNLAGIPGVRPPVPAAIAGLAAPILVKVRRVNSNSKIRAVTGGDIKIAVQPAPGLGVRVLGESNTGQVNVGLDTGVASTPEAVEGGFRVRRASVTTGFDSAAVKVEIHAATATGNVNVAYVPNAPLRTGN